MFLILVQQKASLWNMLFVERMFFLSSFRYYEAVINNNLSPVQCVWLIWQITICYVYPLLLVQKSLILVRIKETITLSRFIVLQTIFRDFTIRTRGRAWFITSQLNDEVYALCLYIMAQTNFRIGKHLRRRTFLLKISLFLLTLLSFVELSHAILF